MRRTRKTKSQLIEELEVLRQRVARFEKLNPSLVPHRAGMPILRHPSRLYKAMASLKPNDHACLIYDSPEEWRAAVTAFILVGLSRGEKCILTLDSHTPEGIRSLLREEQPGLTDAELSRNLVVLHQKADCTRQGSPDVDLMVGSLILESEKASVEGYPRIRMTQEMGAGCEGSLEAEGLLEYEAKLNRDFFPRYPCVAICQYDRWKSHPRVIKHAIMAHPLLIRDNQIHRNFYYVPPEEFLDQRPEDREVQEMLTSIEQEGESQRRVRFLSSVLEQSSQPFAACYPDGRIIICNSSFCALLGRTEEELRHRTWPTDLTDPSCRAEGVKVLERLDSTGQPQCYQSHLLRNDGTRVPVEVSIHPICDRDGNVDTYHLFVRDITVPRPADKMLHEQNGSS